MANSMDELPGDLNCPELHALLLQCRSNDLVDVPDSFFNGMKKLTILRFSTNSVRNWQKLPPSFTNLVNLQMLQTGHYELGDIGIIKNMKNNLEILILKAFHIEELPLEIGELNHLRLLDLRECPFLRVILLGVISKLIRLEELYISQKFDQWEGSTTSNKGKSNVSIAEPKSLKQLTTLYIHIPHVTLWPNDLHFENLIRFQISVGETFDSPIGENSSRILKLDSSRMLKLVGFRLKVVFNVLINRAEVLCLRKLEGLETLFHETHDGGFSNLKYLDVIDCHDLKYLCSPLCAKGLQQRQILHISGCMIMEGIIEIEKERDEEEPENMMIDFSQLKVMELEWLPKLISFFFETKKTTNENS